MQINKNTYFEQITVDVCDCCGTQKGHIETYCDIVGENKDVSMLSDSESTLEMCQKCEMQVTKELAENIITDLLEQGLKLELEMPIEYLTFSELLDFVPSELAELENVTFGIGTPKHFSFFIERTRYKGEKIAYLASSVYAKKDTNKIWLLDDGSFFLEAI